MDPFFISFFSAKDGWEEDEIDVLLCNFSIFHLFCTIISYRGHKRGEEVKYTGKQCSCFVVWLRICYLFRIM